MLGTYRSLIGRKGSQQKFRNHFPNERQRAEVRKWMTRHELYQTHEGRCSKPLTRWPVMAPDTFWGQRRDFEVIMRRLANIHGLLCMALGLLLIITGCTSASHSTGENTIHIVNVGQSVETHHINAGRGHEVRWRNTETQPITVIFPGEYAHRISCRIGFTSVDKTVLSAVIEPNGFASLCFSEQGRYNYKVRLNKNLASGLTEQSATVWIVGRGERNADPYEDYENITP